MGNQISWMSWLIFVKLTSQLPRVPYDSIRRQSLGHRCDSFLDNWILERLLKVRDTHLACLSTSRMLSNALIPGGGSITHCAQMMARAFAFIRFSSWCWVILQRQKRHESRFRLIHFSCVVARIKWSKYVSCKFFLVSQRNKTAICVINNIRTSHIWTAETWGLNSFELKNWSGIWPFATAMKPQWYNNGCLGSSLGKGYIFFPGFSPGDLVT